MEGSAIIYEGILDIRDNHLFYLYILNLAAIMMKSSNVNIFRVTGLLCAEFTGHQWIPHTRASDGELCAWTKGWANNGYAGDLRRHRAHYDVTVMIPK